MCDAAAVGEDDAGRVVAVLGRELEAQREGCVGELDDEDAGAEVVGVGRGGEEERGDEREQRRDGRQGACCRGVDGVDARGEEPGGGDERRELCPRAELRADGSRRGARGCGRWGQRSASARAAARAGGRSARVAG